MQKDTFWRIAPHIWWQHRYLEGAYRIENACVDEMTTTKAFAEVRTNGAQLEVDKCSETLGVLRFHIFRVPRGHI